MCEYCPECVPQWKIATKIERRCQIQNFTPNLHGLKCHKCPLLALQLPNDNFRRQRPVKNVKRELAMVVLCRISAAASLSSTANNFRMAFRETMVVSRVHRLLLLSVVVSMVTTLIRADSRQLRDLPAADAMVSSQCCNKLLR